MLISSYKTVKNSIVAFTPALISEESADKPTSPMPLILGTGFVVRHDGIIATNAHVIKTFSQFGHDSETNPSGKGVRALIWKQSSRGLLQIPLEVIQWSIIENFKPAGNYYGPKEGPDIGLVQVRAKGLLEVSLDSTTVIEEGVEIGTAGFPMGTEALHAPGWLHQVSPTLQRGIVSAVLPFVGSAPHAYSVNVMVQGGASGSPVFLASTGAVIGILYGMLKERKHTVGLREPYQVPTNISYVVPANYLTALIDEIGKEMTLPDDELTLDEIIENLPWGAGN
jgi:S1-C subfamily serine protease